MLAESPKHVDPLVIEMYASIHFTSLTEDSYAGNINHPNYLEVADEPVATEAVCKLCAAWKSRVFIRFAWKIFIKHWWFSGKIGRCQ